MASYEHISFAFTVCHCIHSMYFFLLSLHFIVLAVWSTHSQYFLLQCIFSSLYFINLSENKKVNIIQKCTTQSRRREKLRKKGKKATQKNEPIDHTRRESIKEIFAAFFRAVSMYEVVSEAAAAQAIVAVACCCSCGCCLCST